MPSKFYFNEDVTPIILKELEKSKSYIKIAAFQIHDKRVFDFLERKLKEGITVTIITLPYDSINLEADSTAIQERFEEIKSRGAIVHFCAWNVGDPERTTTAVNRWYAFHGKFAVSDESAMVFSANFTSNKELDVLLILNEKKKIEEFNKKFDELFDWFIKPVGNHQGELWEKVQATKNPRANEVFGLPKSIESIKHTATWIQEYPPELCPDSVNIEERLYLTPFDCRGRNFFFDILEQSNKYIYLSTESFTDDEVPNVLKKAKIRDVDIKVLSGYRSMDFTHRVQSFVKELTSFNIGIKTPKVDIHSKLWITEKLVAISSVNMNKMNLGFKKSYDFWRENTETIYISFDKDLIKIAKSSYLDIFNESDDIIDKLAEKNKSQIAKFLKNVFDVRSSEDAKLYLSKLVLEMDVKSEEYMTKLVKEALEISKQKKTSTLKKEHLEEAHKKLSP